jgi:two-component system, OmpR family, KDP operon response regulator KdpE
MRPQAGAEGPTVLIVEDDDETRAVLVRELTGRGYRTTEAANGRTALERWEARRPDVVLLDLGLPDMDGLQLIRRIRRDARTPIVILSGRYEEREKVEALERGADDYVTKPFGMGELLARVRVALRHAARSSVGTRILAFENAIVDLERRTATRDGVDVRLTPIEFRLLACLAQHLGMVVTHGQLLAEVWGPTHRDDTHYVRIYMKQLREKLEKDPVRPRHLVTETGVGYRLLVDE